MFDFNVLKFFGINTRNGKFYLLFLLDVRWEFTYSDWVKINIDGVVRDSPNLATCGGNFYGSTREFIGCLSAFLNVQIALVVEFYRFIHAIEQAQKMSLTSSWLECDYALVYAAFIAITNVSWGCFVISGTLVLTIVRNHLRFLTFFLKGMHMLINLLT